MTGDRAIRLLTAAVVLAVAAFAAVVSYSHIYDLARLHGQSGIAARLLPLSVDGLILAASLVLLHEARNGRNAPSLARWMLTVGVGATVAANVGFGLGFGLVGALVSAWPAVAFIGAAEMALGLIRRARSRNAPVIALRSTPALGGCASPAHGRLASGSGTQNRPRSRSRSGPVTAEDAEREFMADMASGAIPSLRSIRARMHVGQERARILREHLESVSASHNGVEAKSLSSINGLARPSGRNVAE